MNKQEKIASLENAMQSRLSKDEQRTEYYFSERAPEELQGLFLENYHVRDIDYDIFGKACGMLSDIYNEHGQEKDGLDFVIDQIYERSADSASIYTSTRLEYLTLHNEDDISETMRDTGTRSIAEACAIWYDAEVEGAALLINEWVNK